MMSVRLNWCFFNVHVIYWFDDSDNIKKACSEFSDDGDMPQGSMLHPVYSRV